MASALAWNGWYDPRAVLDGREEIPLLLALGDAGSRVCRRGAARCLVFDSARPRRREAGALDNRYALGEEDAPSLEHLKSMGIRRVQRLGVGRARRGSLRLSRLSPHADCPSADDEVGRRG